MESSALPPNAVASSSSTPAPGPAVNGAAGSKDGADMSTDGDADVDQFGAGRGRKGKRVAYFYDHDVGNFTYGYGHFMKPHRMRMTHDLVHNYGLLDRMDVYRPTRATKNQLTRFHADEYIDFLEEVTPETVDELTGQWTRCLTGDDCPAFEGVFEFCTISAGGSIGAAERLNAGTSDIAINWAGGLHHAKKTEASGFCYVNDIVLGILELLRVHDRVLYIDIDIHHGDGVEEAFYSTNRVMTASFHKFGDFFPGTGDVKDVGIKQGTNYAVNVPLRDGIGDEGFASIFRPVIQHIMDWYRPGAVVLQCGADSLAGDKLGCFNLSLEGHADCVRFVKAFGVPVIMLGGGGYTTKNVSRAWTKETAIMCDTDLDENLPFNHYLEYYGPRYKLEVLANNMDDQNTPEYLASIKRRIIDNLRSMPFAPSAPAFSQPPRTSVGQATGIGTTLVDNDIDNDYDAKIRDIARLRNGSNDSDSDESDADMEGLYGASGRASTSRRKRQGGNLRLSAATAAPKPSGRRGKADLTAKAAAAAAANGEMQAALGVKKRRRFFTVDTPLIPMAVSGSHNGRPHANGKLGKLNGGLANGEDHGVNGLGNRSRYGSPMSVA